MGRYVFVAWVVSIVVAMGQPARAQRPFGDLRGRVTDISGRALEAVVVTARSEALLAPMTAQTSRTGRYRFTALPPGEYELSFERSGSAPRRYPRIVVAPGDWGELDVVMGGTAPPDGTIEPRSESAALSSATYGRRWVALAPIRRSSMFDLLNAAPGVSASTSTDDRAQAFGSSTNENRYFVDGNDVTAPRTGMALARLNPDAVEAIQVLALGASAEYGAAPGAVFNVVTRQGGPAWHGGANGYQQPSSLTGRNTTVARDAGLPFTRGEFHDATVHVGGPIAKDRMWIFGAAQIQRDEYAPVGTAPGHFVRSTARNLLVKATGRLGATSRFQLQYHDDFFRLPEVGAPTVDPSARAERHGHTPAPGATYWTTLGGLFVEARATGVYGRDTNGPADGSDRAAPRFTEFTTGLTSGGIAQWFEGTSSKTSVSARATKAVDGGWGLGHDISLGVQYATGGSDYLVGNNDGIATANLRPVFGYTQAPHHRGGRAREVGVYVDDFWRVGRRLSVNVGVRFDGNRASFDAFPILDRRGHEIGSTAGVSPLFSWDVVSPRAGVVLALDSSGRSVVRANVGRYYRAIVTGEFDVATPSIAPRYWFNGTYDRNGVPADLELIESVSRLRVDPELRNPYLDQLGVSVERQLWGATRVSAAFVHRRGRDHTAWRDIGGLYRTVLRQIEGKTYELSQLAGPADAQVWQLTNPEGMSTEYRGVTVAIENRSARRSFLRAAVTLSESTGRLASSSARVSPAEPQLSTAEYVNGSAFGQNPNDVINTDGLLAGDRPVVFKVQALINGPWRLSAALSGQHQTGRPWGRDLRVVGLGVGTRLRLEPLADDRRVEDITLVDLRVQKSLSLGRSVILEVFSDVLNLFNDDAGESIAQREVGRAGFGVPTEFVWPRRAIVGAKVRF